MKLLDFVKKVVGNLKKGNARQKGVNPSVVPNIEDIILCTPGSIYWKDQKGVYLGCNDYMLQEAGLNHRSQILGKTDQELWPEQAEKIRENDLLVMKNAKPVSMEEHVEGRVFFSIKMPLKGRDNKIIGVICNSHDITYLKEVESALREAKEQSEKASRAKTEFLAIVSHELRSPLTSILGMIHFLRSPENLSLEQYHSYLKHITVSAKHLLSLVDDFLDFTKLEAGKFELVIAPFDLRMLVFQVVTILMPEARAKNIDVLTEDDSDIPNLVLGDSRAVRQILINLLGNAIKFTEEGSVTVKVDVLQKDNHEAKISLAVIDTGIGIPNDKLQLIFDYFQQADHSYARRYGGTGLGLSITRKLIGAMKGTIEVFSEPNKGSTFQCVLPFRLQDKAIEENPWAPYQHDVSVLIVSDDTRREVFKKQIATSQCEVCRQEEALSVISAAEELKQPFDIVIIDNSMTFREETLLLKQIMERVKIKRPMLVLLGETLVENSGFFCVIEKLSQPIELQTRLALAWEEWVENKYFVLSPEKMLREERKAVKFSLAEPAQQLEHKQRVLLVDDDKTVQFVHKEFLIRLECSVDTANSAEEAIVLSDNNHYDVIFTDMGMPGMSGLDFVKTCRKKWLGKKQSTPIIALTSYSSERDKQNFIDAGVDKVLVKPVTPAELEVVLDEFSN